MNILIRADSSSTIGTGHIMRDLVLAKQYKKETIIFATQNLSGNSNDKIQKAGYPIKILQSNSIQELNIVIKKLSINMLIIDHYGIDYKYEKQLKKHNPKLKILSFDDTYEKHYCDILLNHNIYANSKNYKHLVPKKCELRCGSQYTLLRDEFIQEKKKRKQQLQSNSFVINIFIAMGGADTAQLNIPILKILSKFNHIKVNLVTTSSNKNLHLLKNYCKKKPWISLHINSNKIAKFMRKSDFGIITPSVTANELYFMKVPFLAIKTADNQKEMYKFLKNTKYLIMDNFNAVRFKVKAKYLIKSFRG